MNALRRIWDLTATPAVAAMTGAAATALYIAGLHGLL